MLKEMEIDAPNKVWCADVTYIPMRRGYMFLFAILDWYSRKVLAWGLSNTQETTFCLKVLEEALSSQSEIPEVFNTDQGCQFTSLSWSERLKEKGIKISMDGRGRWIDNVVVERFWRSIKYEEIYLREYNDGVELEESIERYILHYNNDRPHQAACGATPTEAYSGVSKLSA